MFEFTMIFVIVLLASLVGYCFFLRVEVERHKKKVKDAEYDVECYRKAAISLQKKAEAKMHVMQRDIDWWKRTAKLASAQSKPVFTEDQLKTLINLCHPDRHNGKQSAVEITQALLSMRTKETK